jgi:aminoglycoside phosphotransferase (APT) family kinase protein
VSRLAAALATCGAWVFEPRPPGKPQVLRRLPGGESNESWLLAWGDRRLVLRLDGVDPASPGLDRAEEVALQGAAAAAGLAPQPRFGGAGFLVSDYVGEDPGARANDNPGDATGGPACIDSPDPDPADAAARARLLRAIHALQVPARRLAPAAYRAACEARAGPVPPALPALARAHCAALAAPGDDPVLCHNDLTAANCLHHGGRLLAIDWEYAARGSRWLDLARATGDSAAAVEAYLARPPTRAERTALAAARALLPYLDALWYSLHGRGDAVDWPAVTRALETADD